MLSLSMGDMFTRYDEMLSLYVECVNDVTTVNWTFYCDIIILSQF